MTRLHLLATLALMVPTLLVPAAAQPAGAGRGAVSAPAADAPDEPEATSKSKPRRSALRFGAENVLAEAGATTGTSSIDSAWTLRAAPYVLWQPDRAWEFRLGIMADGQGQTGTPDFTRWRVDLADSYVRWRSGGTRLTVGAQTILWGRVDGVPVIDRVSRVDLTRLLLDDLADRRRSQWALRWEQSWEEVKLDAVVLPAFVGARLPPVESLWSPLNRSTGRVFGVAASPQLASLVQVADIRQDDGGYGGAAIRLTRTGDPFDFGFTLGRTRQSLPYYEADFRAATMTAVHPFVNFVAVDGELVWAGATWRTELAFSRGVPMTSLTAARVDAKLTEWVGAVEFFPGGKSTRVNLQLVARNAKTHEPVLELLRYVGVNGEVETSFAQAGWKVALQFASGLNVHDLYLGPKLTWVGWEPHEIYLAVHQFKGNERSLGGFYTNHDYVALGWRTRF
jgi:hypothetical protein